MANDAEEYNFEIEMAGLYAGGVVGGLFFGVLGDLAKSEISSMAWYATGTLLGAVAGTVAAVMFRRLVPMDAPDPAGPA
jgi:hypothetical protein